MFVSSTSIFSWLWIRHNHFTVDDQSHHHLHARNINGSFSLLSPHLFKALSNCHPLDAWRWSYFIQLSVWHWKPVCGSSKSNTLRHKTLNKCTQAFNSSLWLAFTTQSSVSAPTWSNVYQRDGRRRRDRSRKHKERTEGKVRRWRKEPSEVREGARKGGKEKWRQVRLEYKKSGKGAE